MQRFTTPSARRVAAFALAAMVVSQPLFAQEPGRPFGLDPYKPSDAKILRDLGPTLVTQMPLSELSKLDPYNPTDAALLRQAGAGIPVWAIAPFWAINPVGVTGTVRRPAALPHRPAPAGATNPHVVWVCKGTACAGSDVRTHEFSKPPLDPASLPAATNP